MVQKLRFKSTLGVYLLEDRLQPNDMFGLGLSLLTGASPTGLSDEQPALLSTQPAQQAVAVVTEVAPEVTSELPGLGQTSQVVQAPAFDAGIIDNVFGAVNAQPTEFTLDNPTLQQGTQAPVDVAVAQAQYAGGVEVVAFGAGTRGNGGQTSTPTPLQGPQVNESLVQAIITGLNKEQHPTRSFATITESGTSVNVNEFGFANSFSAGGGTNQLFNSGYFMSTTGGAPLEISAANCTTVVDIFLINPPPNPRYDSLVQCGNTYVYFIQQVYGEFNLWLTAGFVFGPVSCVYAYNDYDVVDFPNDNGSYQNLGGGLTQMVVRHLATTPKYIFADLSDPAPVHWAQVEYPGLITQITGFSGCGNLGDGPLLFGPGDWTGAFQYNYPPGTDFAVFINFHYRNDANPFP